MTKVEAFYVHKPYYRRDGSVAKGKPFIFWPKMREMLKSQNHEQLLAISKNQDVPHRLRIMARHELRRRYD